MPRARSVCVFLFASSLFAYPACDKAKAPDSDPATKTPSPTEAEASKEGEGELADKRRKDELEHDAKAVQAIHDKMAALLAEARKLVADGDATASIAKYEELLKLDPHYRPGLIELAEAEAAAGNWAAAVHHTKLAAKLTNEADASKAMLLDRIGQYSEKLDKKDDAAHYYRESLKHLAAPEVQARLEALGAVAPELAEPPPGPPGSVDSLKHLAAVVGSTEDVCNSFGADGLCVADECKFVAAKDDASWGVFEVGDGETDCYHPAVRTGDDRWVVYSSALMDSHGAEVHQSVDRLELVVVESEGGPYFVIRYAEHLYERVWDEDLSGEGIPNEDVIDAEGLIVCQRVDGDKTRCTEPIITSLDFVISEHTGKFSAKVELGPDKVTVSDAVKQGKADAAVRVYFYGVLLDPGPHTLPKAI